jgi:hypothetical protein
LTMTWTRRDAYTMQRGPWRVCKTLTHGVPCYTLTHDEMTCRWGTVRTNRILGVFRTFEEAKAEVERLTHEDVTDETDV